MVSSIQLFALHSRKQNLICDDVFYGIVMKYLEKKYCIKCHKWIGKHKVNVCFVNNCTYCFYCRHRNICPK